MTIADRVRNVIAEQLHVEVKSDAEQLNSDLRADSLDTVEITMALEAEFKIQIPDFDEHGKLVLEEHSTVGAVIALVEKHVAARG